MTTPTPTARQSRREARAQSRAANKAFQAEIGEVAGFRGLGAFVGPLTSLPSDPAPKSRPARTYPPKSKPRTSVRSRRKRIRQISTKAGVKKAIVRCLGLLDRKKNGNLCRIYPLCPVKYEHPGTLAYHITPAQCGDAVRLHPDAVVWACQPANYGECRNRIKYRGYHVQIFGAERVERLEAIARETKHYTMTELREMLAHRKAELA